MDQSNTIPATVKIPLSAVLRMAAPARVSVLLITKNGERYLAETLQCVRAQQGRFRLAEIIAVDSGSRDQTLAILESHAVRVIRIPPQEFGHGKTRNLAAAQAQGDYLVFLTQDATPANADWLEALLAPLQADSSIAGAYSRHLPRPDCHPMEWRRIVEDELSGRAESCRNSRAAPGYTDNPASFYFFSNVSSALRRSVWQQFPFPEVEFAEDQLWAKRVLEAGYQTAYRADSLVYHSHGYGAWPNFRRHFDHARALSDSDSASRLPLGRTLSTAWSAARRDLSFWRWLTKQGRLRVGLRWGGLALAWHLAALWGAWLGERKQVLTPSLARRISLQESIKQK